MAQVKRYKKLPVVVESLQWTGDNYNELVEWGAQLKLEGDSTDPIGNLSVYVVPESDWIKVPLNHYIIKGVRGEYYPIADDILNETYEQVLSPAEEALEMLEVFVDYFRDEPCWTDHHGYCQAHWLETDCTVQRAQKYLEVHK